MAAKVLIVDDVESNLYVVKKLMASYGLTVDTVTSGSAAIDKIKGGAAYDIVFMDHLMPEMDGVEATKIIRELGVTIPVIALTASDGAGSKEMFLDAGMNDLLTKPVDKALLEKLLADLLPGKLAGAPEAANAAAEPDAGLWQKIEQIKELSIQTGLDRVSGQREVYEKLLKMTMNEFEKCVTTLNDLLAAGDMRNFSIEVHGMKSALANIGAMEISAQARDLENASGGGDAAFCAANLPSFLEALGGLNARLTEAFAQTNQSRGPVEIPPELPSIFEKLKAAFGKNDFAAIDDAMESLAALAPGGALKEEIDKINEAVLMIDYKGAMDVMQKLVK